MESSVVEEEIGLFAYRTVIVKSTICRRLLRLRTRCHREGGTLEETHIPRGTQ